MFADEFYWEIIGKRETVGLTIQDTDEYSVLVNEDLSDIEEVEVYDNVSKEIVSTENGSIIYFNDKISNNFHLYKSVYVLVNKRKYKPVTTTPPHYKSYSQTPALSPTKAFQTITKALKSIKY